MGAFPVFVNGPNSPETLNAQACGTKATKPLRGVLSLNCQQNRQIVFVPCAVKAWDPQDIDRPQQDLRDAKISL
jgi:hypothetical protein